MSITDEVFLVLLADKLRRAETNGFNQSYTDIALVTVDATAEILAAIGKMSKSSVKEAK